MRLIAVISLFCLFSSLIANPKPNVVQGKASIHQKGHHTVIQSIPNTVIEWNNFHIEKHTLLEFKQASSSSKILNVVTGHNPSQIHGKLLSNGHVFLLNPNGILIGPTGVVDTFGFMAAAMNADQSVFFKSKDLHFTNHKISSVQVKGRILCRDQDVTIIAPKVDLSGDIKVMHGDANVGVGLDVTLKPQGFQKLFIRGKAKVPSQTTAMTLKGKVQALKHRYVVDGSYADLAMHVSDQSLVETIPSDDAVILMRSDDGTISIEGALHSRSKKETSQSSQVHLYSHNLYLGKTAKVSAKTKGAGGQIAIGKDVFKRLSDQVPLTHQLLIDESAVIDASATNHGHGGKIYTWADLLNTVKGTIRATGGRRSGDGGTVEISALQKFYPLGHVDTTSRHGKKGKLILDPPSINITIDEDSIESHQLNRHKNFFGFTFGDRQAGLHPKTIERLLKSNHVIIDTTNFFSNLAPSQGSIEINSPIQMEKSFTDGKHDLTLRSPSTVKINNNVVVNGNLNVEAKQILLQSLERPVNLVSQQGSIHFKECQKVQVIADPYPLSIKAPIGNIKMGANDVFFASNNLHRALLLSAKGIIVDSPCSGDFVMQSKEKGGHITVHATGKAGLHIGMHHPFRNVMIEGQLGNMTLKSSSSLAVKTLNNLAMTHSKGASQSDLLIQSGSSKHSMNISCRNLKLQGGTGPNTRVSILRKGRGKMKIKSHRMELQAGSSGIMQNASVVIGHGKGPVEIRSRYMSLVGGKKNNKGINNAKIETLQASSPIKIVTKDLQMIGGEGSLQTSSLIETKGHHSPIAITADHMNMQGGYSFRYGDASSRIETCSYESPITINVTKATLKGGHGYSSVAEMITTHSSPINIVKRKNYQSLQIAGGDGKVSYAGLHTIGNGDINIDIEGDISIVGGESPMYQSDGDAVISSTGHINIKASHIHLQGGPKGFGSNDAQINSSQFGKSLSIQAQKLKLQGGAGYTSNALIYTDDDASPIRIKSDVILKGGIGANANAEIMTASSTIKMTSVGSDRGLTVISGTGSLSSAGIFSEKKGDVEIMSHGDIAILSDSGTDNRKAHISSKGHLKVRSHGFIFLKGQGPKDGLFAKKSILVEALREDIYFEKNSQVRLEEKGSIDLVAGHNIYIADHSHIHAEKPSRISLVTDHTHPFAYETGIGVIHMDATSSIFNPKGTVNLYTAKFKKALFQGKINGMTIDEYAQKKKLAIQPFIYFPANPFTNKPMTLRIKNPAKILNYSLHDTGHLLLEEVVSKRAYRSLNNPILMQKSVDASAPILQVESTNPDEDQML